jgi:hypothetical protein
MLFLILFCYFSVGNKNKQLELQLAAAEQHNEKFSSG